MSSAKSDNSTCVSDVDPGAELPISWLENAYANCEVPTIVLDEQNRALVANEQARRLLSIDCGATLSRIALRAGGQLGDVINTARARGVSMHTWRGQFECHNHHLEIQFTRLPGPSSLLLCQMQPIKRPNYQIRAQLIAELSEHPQKQDDLDSVAQGLVDTLHGHLDTSAVGHWFEDGELETTWRAGNPEECALLSAPVRSRPDIRGDSLSCVRNDDINAVVLTFSITSDCAAAVSIGIDPSLPEVSPCSPFWTCLAATAKTSLQSARLLEINRQERLRLRAVIEHMPLAVMLFDVDGKVLDLNLRARAMAGQRIWKRVGADNYPFEVCDANGNRLPREKWPLLRAVERGLCCEEEEYVLDFGDRQRTISMTVLPITDENDRVTSYLATGRDVTQRSEVDKRKDEFLSVASHELRSPLTPLSGFIQLCRQQAQSDQDVDVDILKRAEYQVCRLKRLIDGLLDHSRLETGNLPVQRTRVNLRELVQRTMRPWLEGPHGDRVYLSLPEQELIANVDPDRIDQVLTNVVDNAIKHGRDDGQVQICCRRREDEVVLTVQDEGDGMPREIIDRVFERYFYVRKGDASSTGLGLYISRQIVEDHGGSITIDSGRGQPTTVTISLPLGSS